MNVATLAGALIRIFEGLRLTAYQDTGGVWTIGFGHTAGVKQGDQCTPDQAYAWLADDAVTLFTIVEDMPMIAGAAYVSFGYNCGRHSLELVLAGKATLMNYIHDRHGNVLAGLVARRTLEQALIDAVAPVVA